MLRFVLLLLSLAIYTYGHHGNSDEHHDHVPGTIDLTFDESSNTLTIVFHAPVGGEHDSVEFEADGTIRTDTVPDDHGNHEAWSESFSGYQPCDDVSLVVTGITGDERDEVSRDVKTVPGC